MSVEIPGMRVLRGQEGHGSGPDYYIGNIEPLNAYVDDVVKRGKARFISEQELTDGVKGIDSKALIAGLSPTVSAEDFTEILMLSMITECATDSFAARFNESAFNFDADWLRRFNQEVWVPDEYSHASPFEGVLVAMGFDQEDLRERQRVAKEKEFDYGKGITPVGATTFGTIQEYLTDNWHGLTANMIEPSHPHTAFLIRRVKQRETLHMIWNRDMTSLQIEENPDLIYYSAETEASFEMPGNTLIPSVQKKTPELLVKMGASTSRIKRDLVKLAYEMSSGTKPRDSQNAGRLVFEIATYLNIEPRLAFHVLQFALNKFGSIGGFGYGVVGEALLQSVDSQAPYLKGNNSNEKLNIFQKGRLYLVGKVADVLSEKTASVFDQKAS